MINRVLIRIKTVQLLYSYLLVQNPFSLESYPTPPTKEKRFAYELYLDTLYLIYRIACRVEAVNKAHPLLSSRFITKMEWTERFRSLKAKYENSDYPFAPLEEELASEVKNSLLFREFMDDNGNGIEADKFWEKVFNAIILPNKSFNEIVKRLPLYSLSGVERMKGLMQETFTRFYFSKDNIDDALSTLKRSLSQARELYIRLLALPVELTRLRKDQLTLNSKKFLASTEDLNPNMKFVDNVLPGMIEANPIFSSYIENNKISWMREDMEILQILLKDILESSVYLEYMNSNSSGEKEDIELWRKIFRDIIIQNPDFLEFLENKSVFWNDDLDITSTFVFKTLKRFEEGGPSQAVLPMYKDEEDARFGAELFRYVVENRDLYRSYINQTFINDSWEADRLAFMDVVITITALAEILNFPKIPLVASINEYIEIAKSYSTSKSGSFVNGLLGSIIAELKKQGILHK